MEHLVVYVERYHKLSNHQASAFVYFLDRTPHWGISLWRLNKNTLLSWLPWHYLLIGASDVSETERMWEFHRQTGRDKTGLPTHRNMNSFIKKKKKHRKQNMLYHPDAPHLTTGSDDLFAQCAFVLSSPASKVVPVWWNLYKCPDKWKGSVILYTCMKYRVYYRQSYRHDSTVEQWNEATADVWIEAKRQNVPDLSV